MNENDFDLATRAWLDDGPSRMSDHAVLSTLQEIHTTRQRRVLRPAWRATPVSIFARMATVAVLVIAVGLLTFTVVPRLRDAPNVGGPTPSPSATPAADFPALTTTFISPRNGFSVKYFDRGEGTLTPATNRWGLGNDGDVIETGLGAVFKGASLELPVPEDGFLLAGETSSITLDEWIDSVTEDLPTGCGVPRSQQAAIIIDGKSGRISECSKNSIQATVVAGDRLYIFTLHDDRSNARAVFDAFAATIHLTPDTADDLPTPDSTFVSPTNGFSVGYFDRGGLEPAKDLWDPVDPATSVYPDTDHGFDLIDTGFGMAFEGASAAIPNGVSVDAWYDTQVARYLPDECRVSRSQQAEVTIDGRPGRIQGCTGMVTASIAVDGRLYLFIVGGHPSGRDYRVAFDAFAETIQLRPEEAAKP